MIRMCYLRKTFSEISLGLRSNIQNIDLSDTLPEEVEEEVKAAAEISMGTEVDIFIKLLMFSYA